MRHSKYPQTKSININELVRQVTEWDMDIPLSQFFTKEMSDEEKMSILTTIEDVHNLTIRPSLGDSLKPAWYKKNAEHWLVTKSNNSNNGRLLLNKIDDTKVIST